MKTVIKQEFLSSMLLEIIGERESKTKRERDRERVRARERERDRDCLDRERKNP